MEYVSSDNTLIYVLVRDIRARSVGHNMGDIVPKC